jgi:dihydrofolate synthase/folylpolyglutamate synthase
MANSYKTCLNYFYDHIPKGDKARFPGDVGIKRTRYLLDLLKSPQNKLKVIHLAGTSGKGSTAYLTSSLLTSQGFKVGLHLSPHLLDIRERFQINNKLISKIKVISYFEKFRKLMGLYRASKYGELTYFELLVAFAFFVFNEENVDYAVMETGLGGLYDGTNVVSRPDKIAVLTTIGKDHTRILGKTLDQIAIQKAGIIGRGNLAVTAEKRPKLLALYNNIASLKRTRTLNISEGANYRLTFLQNDRQRFDFNLGKIHFKNIQLALLGKHQIKNCSLALAVLVTLSQRDVFQINEGELRETLKNANFPGRFDIRSYQGKNLILDGAHNVQKMKSLVLTLKSLFPNEKFFFVLAFKKDKDYRGMLRLIVPLATKIFLTSFSVVGQDPVHLSLSPEIARNYLHSMGFNRVEIIDNARQLLDNYQEEKLVFTGSLYFLSQVYGIL